MGRRRRRRKKRSVFVRRVSSFLHTYDPYYVISSGIVWGAIVAAIGWWEEGWNSADIGFKFMFFMTLGMSIGLNIIFLIYNAVKVVFVFARKDLLHAVVKLAIMGVVLIAIEDRVAFCIKSSIAGMVFAAFIFCFTMVFRPK